jgi:LysR family hydrogen peroxide-inducible transcriptional activator
MNFQQIKYVLAVHKHKHFGMAAESCHITQATLSAMIKKLESELNLEIFDRSKHPIKTTDQGEAFMAIAKKILYYKSEIQALSQQDIPLAGELRIGIIPTVANTLLPIILPAITSNFPELKLKITEITTDEILQQLLMDKLDLGILATPLDNDDFDETILYYEPMMIYGIADQQKGYVSSEDVKDKRIWLLEEGHCFRNQVMTICEIREKELYDTNLEFEGSSFETLLNLTDTFGGYTLIPELYYMELSKEKQARTKYFQPPVPVREISIVSYRPAVKANAVSYLKGLITELVGGKVSTNKYQNNQLDIIGI